ncbi:hypothetical protein Q31b_18860 [Novipirellula aureliae]|uniref:Methyltransferase FkbM domain-containing protein n=2 Tax=Novipirellula aureliae TaxID=2527966 RepID=A0A5C6E6D0_9BACT|nr:hypothetical protein Q31b_18860 [Novipirellula aureliae]
MFRRIRTNRRNAISINCALVSEDYGEKTVAITPAHAMSRICSAESDPDEVTIDVPARTLTSILDEVNPPQVDLLSLDVDGFEYEVLRGLDLDRWKPGLIIVECLTEESRAVIHGILSCAYDMIAQPTFRDYVYRARSIA